MTSEEFTKAFYLERKWLMDLYFNPESGSDVSEFIVSMNLDEEGKGKMKQILKAVLRDAFYTTLLGIDGQAQIGGRQVAYVLFDEDGNELTNADLEAHAYEYFHNR